MVASVNYERQLPLKMFGSVGYTWTRGVHLLRTRNVNAPTGFDNGVPIVPLPAEGPILEYESNGLSTRNQLSLNVRTGFSQKLTIFANYSLASMHNNTDGANSNPANPYDLSTEWGRAGGDVRHNFFIGGQITGPLGLRFNPFITARSGAPFNILTGRDNNRDNQYSDRPSFANPGDPGAIVTRFGTFNPDPLPGEQIIPRNFGQGPGFISVNMGVSRTFGFGPAPNNMRAANATRNGQTGPDGQPLPQNQNQRGTRGAGTGTANRGEGGGGGGFGGGGGGPQMITRGGGGGAGGGGNAMMMGGGSDARHKYNLTVGINALDIFNHANLAGYNGVLTSSFFGQSNSTVGSRGGFGGGGARRVDLSLRFSF